MSLAYLAHRKCVYISIHCYYHSLNLLGSETKACCRWSSGEGRSSNHGYDSTKWDCWILLLTWTLSAQSPSHWSSSVCFQTVLSSFLSGQDPLTSSLLSALLVFCQHFHVHTFGEPVSLLGPQSASLLIIPSYLLLLGQEEPPWEVRGGERLWIIILLIFFYLHQSK